MSTMSFHDGYQIIMESFDRFRGMLNNYKSILYIIHAHRVGLFDGFTEADDPHVFLYRQLFGDKNIYPDYERGLFDVFKNDLSYLGEAGILKLCSFLKQLSQIEQDWFDAYEKELFDALITSIADYDGKSTGEYTQPYELTKFVSAVSGYNGKGIMYNPFAGSATYCIEMSGEGSFIGQELSPSAWAIGVLRLLAHKKDPSTFILGNSIYEWQGASNFTDNQRLFDLIVATPPFSLRLNNKPYEWAYGGFSLGEDVFIWDSLRSLSPNGIAIGVFASGITFRGAKEAELRKSFVDNDKLDTVISLPAGIFRFTGIPTVILKFSNKKENPGYVRIVDGSSFVSKVKGRPVVQFNELLSAIEDENPEFVKTVSLSEIKDQDYNLHPRRYFQQEEVVPEGFTKYSVSDLLEVIRGERVAAENVKGVFVNIASLSDDPFSYQLDLNAPSEPLNSQYRKVTVPAVLVSKIRDLKPTFVQASEDHPIYVHPNVLALRVLDDSKVFIPCLILELSKASSKVPKAGVIPSMQQSDILQLQIVLPDGKSLQEAFYLNAEKERKVAQIRELGLEGMIRTQKAEYEAIIRRRKHDLNNMLGDTCNYIDAISTFLDSKGYSDEIMDEDLKVSLGQILSHIQTSLSSMSGIIRHLDDDEVYAEPEVIDLVPRLKALANEAHRNYSVRYSADSYSLCDVVQDDDELHAWVKFGSVNLDRVFFNIVQNAEKHGFVDPSRTDYMIDIELSHDYDSACFIIRFKNNGKPLPLGMNTRRYGTRAESAGTTAGNGDGGAIVKTTVEHYGGTVEVINNPDEWFPVCIEIKLPHYDE